MAMAMNMNKMTKMTNKNQHDKTDEVSLGECETSVYATLCDTEYVKFIVIKYNNKRYVLGSENKIYEFGGDPYKAMGTYDLEKYMIHLNH
jgi:hypothetical protein